LPLQQPPGHDAASQMHLPLALHSCPDAHAAHAAPPVPHDEADSDEYGSQLLPLQQPPAQEVALHTHWPVPLQPCPVAQALHAAPPVPQELLDSLP
jgi:hypothetical protein